MPLYHAPLSASPLVRRKEVLTKVGQEERWKDRRENGASWMTADKHQATRGRRAANPQSVPEKPGMLPLSNPPQPQPQPIPIPPADTTMLQPVQPFQPQYVPSPMQAPLPQPVYSPQVAFPAMSAWGVQAAPPMPYIAPQLPAPLYGYTSPPVAAQYQAPVQAPPPPPPYVPPKPAQPDALPVGDAKFGRRHVPVEVEEDGGFLWRLGMGADDDKRVAKEQQKSKYKMELEAQIRSKNRQNHTVPHHLQTAGAAGGISAASPSANPTAPGERTGRGDYSYSKLRAQVSTDQDVARRRQREEATQQLQRDLELQIEERRLRKEEDERKRKASEEKWDRKYGHPEPRGAPRKTGDDLEKEKVMENQLAQSNAAQALMDPKFAPLKKVYHHQRSHNGSHIPHHDWEGVVTQYDEIAVGNIHGKGGPVNIPLMASMPPPKAAPSMTPFIDKLEQEVVRKREATVQTLPDSPLTIPLGAVSINATPSPPPPLPLKTFKAVPTTDALSQEERFREQDERMSVLDSYIPLHTTPLPRDDESVIQQDVSVNVAARTNDEISKMSERNRTRLKQLHNISEKIESPSCSKSEADLLLRNFAADGPNETSDITKTPAWLQSGFGAPPSTTPSPFKLVSKTPVMLEPLQELEALPSKSTFIREGDDAMVANTSNGIVFDPISKYATMNHDELPAWLREDEEETQNDLDATADGELPTAHEQLLQDDLDKEHDDDAPQPPHDTTEEDTPKPTSREKRGSRLPTPLDEVALELAQVPAPQEPEGAGAVAAGGELVMFPIDTHVEFAHPESGESVRGYITQHREEGFVQVSVSGDAAQVEVVEVRHTVLSLCVSGGGGGGGGESEDIQEGGEQQSGQEEGEEEEAEGGHISELDPTSPPTLPSLSANPTPLPPDESPSASRLPA